MALSESEWGCPGSLADAEAVGGVALHAPDRSGIHGVDVNNGEHRQAGCPRSIHQGLMTKSRRRLGGQPLPVAAAIGQVRPRF